MKSLRVHFLVNSAGEITVQCRLRNTRSSHRKLQSLSRRELSDVFLQNSLLLGENLERRALKGAWKEESGAKTGTRSARRFTRKLNYWHCCVKLYDSSKKCSHSDSVIPITTKVIAIAIIWTFLQTRKERTLKDDVNDILMDILHLL